MSGPDSRLIERETLRTWLQDLVDRYTVVDRAVDHPHQNSPVLLQASQNLIRSKIRPNGLAESFVIEVVGGEGVAQSLIPEEDLPEQVVRQDIDEPDPQTGCTQ